MKKEPRGISLLLTLFILSSILVAALSSANLIFRELKISGSSDRGVRAFYAAESGLEDALYRFRQLNETSLIINEGSAVDIGSGSWWRNSANTIDSLETTLLENEDVELALFNPASSDQAQSIKINWSSLPSVCPGADYTWLEVVQSYWDTSLNQSKSVRVLFSPSDALNCTQNNNCPTVNMNGSLPYVRMRALFGDACNLSLTAFYGTDGTGNPFLLPEQLKITSTGEVADSRQILSVTVPARAAQFGAFDYTLFSEQPICKDVSPCN